MTDRPFTTPEHPSPTSDGGLHESPVGGRTTSTFAEAQVDASPSHADTFAPDPTSAETVPADTREPARETAATAKDEARSVAADARQSAGHVADTARTEARDVAAHTQQQARELFEQLRTEANDQASSQTRRAVGGLRTLADELGEMAAGGQHHGVASDVAHQAATRARGFAEWLDHREPGDILDEARSFARRKPGTFLAAAAALGFLGGRLTRGLADDGGASTSADSSRSFDSSTPTYGGEPYAAEAADHSFATDPTAADHYTATSPMAADTDRVGAGTDPVTYSHPDPEHRPVDTGHGFPSGTHGQETR